MVNVFGWLKRRKAKKEYLSWLAARVREGVNPAYRRPLVLGGLVCPNPNCLSDQVRSAGYGDRFECQSCGRVFSR